MVAGTPLYGQVPSTAPRLQLGAAAIPGIGLQGGYVAPRSFYTVEAALYADATPKFSGGEGSLLLSLGLGGAIRPLGLLRMIGNTGYTNYDVDFGLRFGPALFFAFNDTRATKNQSFSLFVDPYLRFTSELKGDRTFFIEAGLQRPLFRAGLWLNI